MNDVKDLIRSAPVPILYTSKEDCDGCGICLEYCPMEAICMEESKDDHPFPHINPEKCVRCRMCMRVCPLKQ